jgi:lipid II:glycine glycyltransferase (peptidoglycan interpeptide bridge formation enzyme)
MYNSIFQKEWWLDAVAPGRWDAVEIKSGNETVARLPYVIENKYGLTILTQPLLTQTLGPWLKTSEAKYSRQLSEQKDLMMKLIEALPQHDYFLQNFHNSITNWLPFYWKGFKQTTEYTYVIENLSDPEKIWSEFRENIRRNIRKAQKKVKVRTDLSLDEFLNLNVMTFKRQGKNIPYTKTFVKRLDNACVSQNARRIFFAEDAESKIHAAIYIIWDDNSAYYLMGGEDPKLRNSEATSLLIWEAINFASTVTKKFDFEGSMIESIEMFFRGFGSKQVPYSHITGMSRRMKVLMHGRSFLRSIKGKHGI